MSDELRAAGDALADELERSTGISDPDVQALVATYRAARDAAPAVDPLRDDLARALASETVREIVEQITTQSGDAPSCPGQTFDPPCGACPACMIAQATVHLHTDEGWRELQAQADRLLVHVHAQAAYRAARDAAPAEPPTTEHPR